MEPTVESIMTAAPVIPVLTVPEAHHAEPLAEALVGGGLPVLEVTLRTPAALEAIRRMRRAVPQAIVGAGTVLDGEQLRAALDAGAQFVVTPGTPAPLAEAVAAAGVPALPGAATVTEMIALRASGFRHLKFFPAGVAGGIPYLRAVAAPLAGLVFCPTGGVTPENAADWLALPNVVCVGGTWVAPAALVADGDWAAIGARARAAAALLPG